MCVLLLPDTVPLPHPMAAQQLLGRYPCRHSGAHMPFKSRHPEGPDSLGHEDGRRRENKVWASPRSSRQKSKRSRGASGCQVPRQGGRGAVPSVPPHLVTRQPYTAHHRPPTSAGHPQAGAAPSLGCGPDTREGPSAGPAGHRAQACRRPAQTLSLSGAAAPSPGTQTGGHPPCGGRLLPSSPLSAPGPAL